MRSPFLWMLVLFLAIGGYFAWREYDYQQADIEAKEVGFRWEAVDPVSLIRQDWHAAMRKETWATHRRTLVIGDSSLESKIVLDLEPYRDLIHRLSPTELVIYRCKNVDALKGLDSLQSLYINVCHNLQNLDALKGLTKLQRLELNYCYPLQNVDALKSLTGLHELFLGPRPNLQNLDALKGHPSLKKLEILHCPTLEKVEVLKSLTGLLEIHFAPNPYITKESMNELRAILPNTTIAADVFRD